MKLELFFEEKRVDDNQEEFYLCKVISQNKVSISDEFFYLYDESLRVTTQEEICLKVERITLRPNTSIDTVYHGHWGGFYFSGCGHEKLKCNMSLTNFKVFECYSKVLC